MTHTHTQIGGVTCHPGVDINTETHFLHLKHFDVTSGFNYIESDVINVTPGAEIRRKRDQKSFFLVGSYYISASHTPDRVNRFLPA